MSLYKCGDAHLNHAERGKMLSETKEAITALFKDGTRKPNPIILALKSRGMVAPPRTQLTNYLTYLRKKFCSNEGLNQTISMEELEEWCQEKTVSTEIYLSSI